MKKEIFIQYLKNIKPRDLAYPGVLILFFGIVIVVFFFMIQFISKNINKAFSPEENTQSQALNIEKYKLIAKKLNISLAPANNTTAPAEITTTQATTTVATSTPVVILDKKNLTIIINNSTPKKGVATALAKAIEDSGFAKPQTGNEPKSYVTTTILLKKSKSDYETLLLEVVRKTYPDAIATTSESGASDATIIIGVR